VLEAPEVRFPSANLKVKIMLAVSRRDGRLRTLF